MPGVPGARVVGVRVVAVLVAAAAILLAGAAPASAHTDRGVAGSNFAGRILATSAAMPGVTLEVTEFGDSLTALNASSETLTVYGYSDEEYLRIGPDGVWRNANSPATYLNLGRDGDVDLPANADAAAEPDWRQVSTRPRYEWHDHRTHWMLDSLPPRVAADPASEHTVIEWEVPLAYAGEAVTVEGELTWSPPPRAAVWWPVYAVILLAGLAAGLGRTARPLAALLALSSSAAAWHLLATPQFGLTATDRALALATASLPAVALLGLAVLAVRAAVGGKDLLAAMLAAVAGFLLLVQGLPDMDVLWSANVITAGPVVLARITVALLLLGGLGLLGGSALAVRRFRPTLSPHAGDPAPATGR